MTFSDTLMISVKKRMKRRGICLVIIERALNAYEKRKELNLALLNKFAKMQPT